MKKWTVYDHFTISPIERDEGNLQLKYSGEEWTCKHCGYTFDVITISGYSQYDKAKEQAVDHIMKYHVNEIKEDGRQLLNE